MICLCSGGASSTLSDFSGSYCYGITPGISAVGVIPPSLEADCSYVVCHREDIGGECTPYIFAAFVSAATL
ncbi:hypothetical protein DPMN_069246 [Dreissena polymorpha]|uniref:Uncharacterized protein n=1 Tax=Dreissena polymorpha TaxID=45954 RepID=A0A9D3Z2V2_DREPO|nr:hypothetical protein DPMN_069246 [Dreissena polymorpha]